MVQSRVMEAWHMETSGNGNQCTDPKLRAAEQKEWGLTFCSLVLENQSNYLLMRLICWYKVCQPFQGCWPSSMSISRSPHQRKVNHALWNAQCTKKQSDLLLEKELPYLWRKEAVSGILSPWMEIWSDLLMGVCDTCGVFCLFFAGARVGNVMEVTDVKTVLDLT